ncbi:hypothetical protein [uncultured Ornithinimicrobium sp.]|uniref:hypothetical protein n=1 Tax=uncultured Ornithinimicrobium sp. TaxID=259307 RepID=UPI00259167B4|nr:hypothetical protein [uncultured Ornithinimicrobium sp.]
MTSTTESDRRLPTTGLIACLGIAALMAALSIWAYPSMVPEIVTREANGRHGENSPGRAFTAAALPITLVGVGVLMALAAKLNPRFLERFPRGAHPNYRNSVRVLNVVLTLVAILLLVMHVGLLALYLDRQFPLESAMVTAVGVVLIGLGVVLPLTRPEGRFTNSTAERARAASAKTYRAAGYWLALCGFAVIVLAWISSQAAMVVGVGGLVLAFAAIIVTGLRAALRPPA